MNMSRTVRLANYKSNIFMIDNVFVIKNRRSGLEKASEYWQSASYEEKSKECLELVKVKMNFVPRPTMKYIREGSFLVKASTSIGQLKGLAVLLRKRFKIDCFQISIDRESSVAHMLFTWLDEDARSIILNYYDQKKLSVMVLRFLHLPRPQSVDTWLRYFLLDAFEADPDIFRKQLDILYHAKIENVNLSLFHDVMLYAEAMCKGQLK